MSEQIQITLAPGQLLSLRHEVHASYWVAYEVESFRDNGEEAEVLLVNPENREDTVILRIPKPA